MRALLRRRQVRQTEKRLAASRTGRIPLTARAWEWKDLVSLKPHRPLLAALMLLAWFVTNSHIVHEHGGDWWGCHAPAAHDGGHHHNGDSDHPGEPHHHHDLGAVLLGKILSVQKAAPASSAWPLSGTLGFAQVTADIRLAPLPLEWTAIGDSPPDARSSGWLFAVQTARPVRGPSLAA
jgi:hypothetical protein